MMIDFNAYNLFPTTIGSCINKPLAEKVLPFAKEILGTPQHLTNAWGYKNTYGNRRLPDTLIYKELRSFIVDVSKSFSKTLGIKTIYDDVDLFFSEMKLGDDHPYHAHPDSIFSGVFYLNVPENSAPIRFYDPRPFKEYITYDTEFNQTTCEVKPQAGQILIWQSWLPHEVLKNRADNRMTVVFNIT